MPAGMRPKKAPLPRRILVLTWPPACSRDCSCTPKCSVSRLRDRTCPHNCHWGTWAKSSIPNIKQWLLVRSGFGWTNSSLEVLEKLVTISNILCRFVVLLESTSKSSAYATTGTWQPYTDGPRPLSSSCCMRGSRNMFVRHGDRRAPCLTPRRTSKESDRTPLNRTRAVR